MFPENFIKKSYSVVSLQLFCQMPSEWIFMLKYDIFTQTFWFVFVFLLVVCLLHVYEVLAMYCGIYDVIMASHNVILLF